MAEIWSEYVLAHFPKDDPYSRLVLVEDADSLLADGDVFRQIAGAGYRVEPFVSTLSLRNIYETTVRTDVNLRLAVLFRGGVDVDKVVPYDMRHAPFAQRVTFSMENVFPHLDGGVLRELDRRYITDLYYRRRESEERGGGVDETCEFIYEDLLEMSVTGVHTLPALFALLFKVHVRERITSPKLLRYLVEKIRNKVDFGKLSQDGILRSAACFREWIEYAWKTRFLGRPHTGALPVDAFLVDKLDFGDRRVRETMQSLFRMDWISMDGDMDELGRQYDYLAAGRMTGATILDLPLQELRGCIPQDFDKWEEWIRFAHEWAAFTALADSRKIDVAKYETVRQDVDERFTHWLIANYASLAAIPSASPVMVHHVIRTMAKIKKDEHIRKVALIVMDGMAWNQWVPIRQQLEQDFRLTVNGTFACVPTLTSVSRQAIFSGLPPEGFAKSIKHTNSEPALWRKAWQGEGIDPAKVKYMKALGQGNPHEIKDAVYTNVEVLGAVIDTIDGFSHNALAGNREMHGRIREWLRGDYLKELLHDLVDVLGFAVFITSDHGNVECKGTGKLSEGVLAGMKGERTRVYVTAPLRQDALGKYPQALAWDGDDLPPDFKPIVLAGRDAFQTEGESLVSHGGISLEEVIVPFVRVERKNQK